MLPRNNTFSRNQRPAESVDEALDRLGFGRFHIRFLILLGLVHIADINFAFLSPFVVKRVSCDWTLNHWSRVILTAVTTTGICLGNTIAGFLADQFGRRHVLIATCFSATLFGALTSSVTHYTWLLVLSFLSAFAVGGIKCVALVYLLEFLPKENRGKLLVSFLFFWTLGCLFNVMLVYLVNQAGWRSVVGLSVIPSALATVIATFLPQSPHFLFSCNRFEETDEVLSMVGLTNRCLNADFIVPLCPPDKQSLEDTWQEALQPSSCALFFKRFRLFFGLFLLWFMLVFTSSFSKDVNYILPFTPQQCMSKQAISFLLRLRSFSDSDLVHFMNDDDSCCSRERIRFTVMLINALHYGVGGLLALLVIDQMGRRISIMFCSGFACLLFVPLNFCSPTLVREVLMALITSCSAAAQGILAVYSAELWPTTHRAFLLGICWSVGAVTKTMELPILNLLVTVTSDRPVYIFNTVILLVSAILPLILPFDTKDWSLVKTPKEMLQQIDTAVSETPLKRMRKKKNGNVNEKTPLR